MTRADPPKFRYARFPGSTIWHTLIYSGPTIWRTACGRVTGPWDNLRYTLPEQWGHRMCRSCPGAVVTGATVTHDCPPEGSGVTPCCGRTPFELPGTDRMTLDHTLVTCEGASRD